MPIVHIHRRTCQGIIHCARSSWAKRPVPHAGWQLLQLHRATRRGPRVSTHRCHKLAAMRMQPTHAIALSRAGSLLPASRRVARLALLVWYRSCVRRTERTCRRLCSARHPFLYSQPGFHPAKDCCDLRLPSQKTCETPAQHGFSPGLHFQRGRRWVREKCSNPRMRIARLWE